MKKKLKRLFVGDRGSVSIFAIIIIVPIFMLNALFIDTLRIFSAERQVENALENSLRSTMAQFNEKLSGVGLFGYAGNDENDEFEGYVRDQFYNAGELSGVQNLATPKNIKASASFDSSRDLVDLGVFKHQVLESMKYQAPAQLGQELVKLVSKIKISKDDSNRIEDLSKSYEEIFELARKRNKKIEDAKKEINKYIELAGALKGIPEKGETFSSEKEIPETIKNGMNGLIHYQDRYKNLKKKDKLTSKQKNEVKNYENAVKSHKRASMKIFTDFSGSREKIRKKFAGVVGEPNDPFAGSAADLNADLKKKIDDLDLEGLDLGEDGEREIAMLKKLPLKEEFFTDILDQAEYLDKQFNTNAGMDDPLNANLADATIYKLTDGFYQVIENHKQRALSIKDMFKRRLKIINNGEHIGKIKSQLEVYEDSKEILKSQEGVDEKEDEADDSYDELWDLISGGSDLAKDQDTYKKLEGIVGRYEASGGGSADNEDKGRTKFVKNAFNRFNEFIDFMKGFPEKYRNELYINEYVMANYGTSEPYELGKGTSYLYKNKEAQYIMYGYHDAGVNYARFVLDIAMVLFIVNLLEKVLMEAGFSSPLGFLRAVIKAFGDTVMQIKTLTDKTFITKGYKLEWRPFKVGMIEMTPSTFVRIFMLMRSAAGKTSNNNKLRRVQAAVTYDTSKYLDKSHTYLEGSVEADLDLWFIPAIVKLLPDKDGKRDNNVYKIKMEKVYSY